MSVEPVTVTTTDNTPQFHLEDHRNAAAEQMGLDPTEIHCVSAGIETVAQVSPDVISEDGTLLQNRVMAYTHTTTWAQTIRIPLPPTPTPEPEPEPWIQPPAAPAPEPVPWPDVKLPRGARWHGNIPGPITGMPIEATLISDGERLVLIDSAEGKLLMNEMGGEKPITTILPANTFG